jgi:endonuclease-3
MSSEVSEATRDKALEIYDLLVETYGEKPQRKHREPVEELVLTILSQNTSDVNSGRAFENLQEAFPTWDEVVEAPTEEVAEAIRVGGLANQKAPRIQNALEKIHKERGAYELDFLQEMDLDEARDWLTDLHGVGPKTASVVLLFSLEMSAFPVDTHVHRVSRRLGIIPEDASPEKASDLFEEMLSEDLYHAYHLLLIQHGRNTCKAQRPLCEECPLTAHCDYYEEDRAD